MYIILTFNAQYVKQIGCAADFQSHQLIDDDIYVIILPFDIQ